MYKWRLEIEKYGDLIVRKVNRCKTVIIKGPTGCGKSTYVPTLFKNKNVAIIEPRRLAVLSLYDILKQEIDNCGYKMRFNKINIDRNKNYCMLYTDGAFLADLDLSYDIIIIDEVHERSIRTDVLLMILKKRYKGKLIMMSATLETKALEKYFEAELIDIKCKSYKVKQICVEKPVADYILEGFLRIKEIAKNIENDDRKDVLVFLPGIDEINEMYKLCRKIPTVKTYKIYSAMEESDQMKVFKKTHERKIILATNVCETSLTIPSVKYVIDTGLCKNKIFKGIGYFGIQKISKESISQREGRCNRLGDGVCYKLYKKETEFIEGCSQIEKTELSTMILMLLKNKIDITSVDFINKPPVDNLKTALSFLDDKKCVEITKVDENIKIRITSYGKMLIQHPFDISLSNFYECSILNGYGKISAAIISLISLENYNFMFYKEKQQQSDIEYLLFIFEEYVRRDDKAEFCKKYGLPVKGMDMAYKIYKSLSKKGDKIEIDGLNNIFSRCFSHNSCLRQADGSYMVERTGQIVWLHPSSTLFKKNFKKIVVVDFFCTTKVYCRIAGRFLKQIS